MENLSRTVWSPPMSGMDRGSHWYYERARGSYLDDKSRQGTPARQKEWAANNPSDRKFTKTDLAKYEHAWIGMPHLVCRGAEKNFLAFAERLEDDGEPTVDLDYFKHTIAKAILFRTAEKLFSALALEGYRANSVAYAVAWLAKHSEHRIDLNRIWEEQRVPHLTQEALKAACQAAYTQITQTGGNVGEWSKKSECWDRFQVQEISLPGGWETEWAETPFRTVHVGTDTLAAEWELVRIHFVSDNRSLGELEALTGRQWMGRYRGDEVRKYAQRRWNELKGTGGRRLKNIRDLIDLLSAAAELSDGSINSDSIAEDVVIVGRTARVVDLADGTEQNICVVDEVPNEPADDGVLHVSAVSPLGQALQMRRVGETVEVHAPRGVARYRIDQVL